MSPQASISTTQPFGALLRQWRTVRKMSQLALALEADISARHLSFLETGRAQPSRDMALLLATSLDVPLRERNRWLMAAGYAPIYRHAVVGDGTRRRSGAESGETWGGVTPSRSQSPHGTARRLRHTLGRR